MFHNIYTIIPLLMPFLSFLTYMTLVFLALLELAVFLWIIAVLYTHIHKLKLRRKLWTQEYKQKSVPATSAPHPTRRVSSCRTKRLHYWDY
jgi:hypothetical protein